VTFRGEHLGARHGCNCAGGNGPGSRSNSAPLADMYEAYRRLCDEAVSSPAGLRVAPDRTIFNLHAKPGAPKATLGAIGSLVRWSRSPAKKIPGGPPNLCFRVSDFDWAKFAR